VEFQSMDSNGGQPQTIRWPTAGEVIANGSNRYVVGQLLGRGGYGAAYAVTDQWDNSLVLKVLVPRGQSYEQVRNGWEREISSLLTLRHPSITYVYDAFELAYTFHIVVERCRGSLTDLFAIPNYDGYQWLYPIARCVLQGIGYMHDNGYVHKDIHLRNIFWTYLRNELLPSNSQSVSFKIGDLGIARLETDIDSYRPTVPWMHAPEAIDPSIFGPAGHLTDLYNVGLVLLAVALGYEPSLTREQIVAGVPAQMAAQLRPPFNMAIAQALNPYTQARTQSAFAFWCDLIEATSPG
jgi:serine/threonine-protein kinase